MCKQQKEKESNPLSDGKDWYRRLIVGCAVSVLVVFILLPGLFLILGAVFPNTFSTTGALQQLWTNINSLVGIVSLILGAFSIYCSWKSERVLEGQRKQQEEFLQKIDKKIDEIKGEVTRLHYDNENIKERLYDIVNMRTDLNASADRTVNKDNSCEQESTAFTKKDESN